MRNLISFIIVTSLLFLLTGCFGAKEIEAETYVTAIGIDYNKGKFKLYIQGLNFGNIAKQEGASLEQQPILIGEAKGESISAAAGLLEQRSSLPLNYGHVHTFILSKNIIKEKMADVIDLISHAPLLRYNFFIFGTEENLKSLMQTQSFFNYPQLYSVIHRPERLIRYNYSLPVMTYNQFTSRYYRPVGTILIPSLTIDKTHFSEGKEKALPVINGEYLISKQRFKGWLGKKDLSGLRWIKTGIQDTTLRIGTESISVRVKNPKTKIMVLKGKNPTYKIVVKGEAVLVQNRNNKQLKEVENVLNKKIKNEILSTVKKGDQLNTDVLNISEKPYKYDLNHWNIETIRRFNVHSVKEVQVKIQVDPGNFKY
ncbi:Ger(x)C family spore germination protein [Bacillus salipaludis]|uniref:Ger(X)C family spore germination protein n=1 Tax=Bacillus salipaludis TaxID=2547811 RepID=A0A4R5VMM5_9BACI|nr:Ger(x)C family spore germination protein [Bacillus salipaludis]MDQ6598228.1 Ger(x)C family spore germination protein [Bacillus salipaludis]TDK59394.1 Ger(x)C family spore germination protein [Bacillus salipaludis]